MYTLSVRFKKLYSRLIVLSHNLQAEDGIETIEWIGLAAVVLVLLGAVATVFGGDSSVGNALTGALVRLIDMVGGG